MHRGAVYVNRNSHGRGGYHVRETAIIGCCVCVMLAVLMAIFQHIFEKDDVYKHTTYPFKRHSHEISTIEDGAYLRLCRNAPSPHKEFITNNVKERLKHIKKFDLTKMETALPNDTILGNLDTEELRLSKIHYDEKLVTELAKALARYFKEHFDKIGEE